jgi:hypothetical protein
MRKVRARKAPWKGEGLMVKFIEGPKRVLHVGAEGFVWSFG